MASTETVIPSSASALACVASSSSAPVLVKPSVNKMMCFNFAFDSRSACAAFSSGWVTSVPPAGVNERKPLVTTSCAGSFCNGTIHFCSELKASTPTSSLADIASTVRAAAALEMSVLLTPPWAPMTLPRAITPSIDEPAAQWHEPIEPDVSMASTWATSRRRFGSRISLTTGNNASSSLPR